MAEPIDRPCALDGNHLVETSPSYVRRSSMVPGSRRTMRRSAEVSMYAITGCRRSSSRSATLSVRFAGFGGSFRSLPFRLAHVERRRGDGNVAPPAYLGRARLRTAISHRPEMFAEARLQVGNPHIDHDPIIVTTGHESRIADGSFGEPSRLDQTQEPRNADVLAGNEKSGGCLGRFLTGGRPPPRCALPPSPRLRRTRRWTTFALGLPTS